MFEALYSYSYGLLTVIPRIFYPGDSISLVYFILRPMSLVYFIPGIF